MKGPPPIEQEPKPPPVESQVPGWDANRVQDWLAANNVTTRNKTLTTLNGTQLLQLKKQLVTVPQAFYKSMVVDLKVPFTDVLSLAAALERADLNMDGIGRRTSLHAQLIDKGKFNLMAYICLY